MMPQMSVLPSRPLATKTSGGLPAAGLEWPDVRLLELADQLAVRRPPQLVDRRPVHPAIGIDHEAAIGRILDRVAAVALRQCDQIAAIETDAIVDG